MSEKEKRAIELLKKLQKKTPYIIWGDGTPYNKSNQIQTILNLIDNQQKEIEELKHNRDEYKEEYIKLLNARYYNYISKDKIREIIAEYQKQLKSADTERTAIMLSNFIMVLNDLLEEN